MIREVIATGRDVNTAIDQGCSELGIDREDAQFEIISLPKKGFLGLKNYPAKVRIYQELPDVEIRRAAPAPKVEVKAAPAPQAPKAVEARPVPAPQAPKAVEARPVPAPQAPKAVEARPVPAPQAKPVEARPERPARPVQDSEQPLTEITPTDEVRAKVEKSAAYLADIMRAMGFEAVEVTPRYYSENVCLQLAGAQMGMVIGRRGETLDALQYLTSLVANRGEGDYIRISIDSGNYREKREKTLTALARKLALQAVRTGKSTTLEPMNPYERRVIHGAVSQIRGAASSSVGADPNRRVVISCEDPSKIRPRTPDGDRPQRTDRPVADRPVADRPERTDRPAADRGPRREGDRPQRTDRPASDRGPRRDDRSRGPRRDDRGPRRDFHEVGGLNPDGTATPTQPREKLSDADLFGDLPIGVPLVHGQRVERPARVEAPKHEPRKLDDLGEVTPKLYGKIDVEE